MTEFKSSHKHLLISAYLLFLSFLSVGLLFFKNQQLKASLEDSASLKQKLQYEQHIIRQLEQQFNETKNGLEQQIKILEMRNQ